MNSYISPDKFFTVEKLLLSLAVEDGSRRALPGDPWTIVCLPNKKVDVLRLARKCKKYFCFYIE